MAFSSSSSSSSLASRGLSALVNPLATNEQLQISSSQLDGVPVELENSVRFAACRLIQAAGVLLGLSQDIIVRATVLFSRFWIGSEGGSLKIHNAVVCNGPSGQCMSPKLRINCSGSRSGYHILGCKSLS